MPYILSAQEAGMLAAGSADDSHNCETQRLLTLVECAVRSACSKKKNSVKLLAPDFRGWDKNNIKTLSPCAGEVLDALSKAGYHFYTCHLVKLGSEYGDGLEIPYTHTVITWPQVTAVDTTKFNVTVLKMPSQEGYTSIGEAFVDSLPVQEKPPFRQELPGDFYVKRDSSTVVEVGGSEEGDLALAEGIKETLSPVCISKHGERWSEEADLFASASILQRAHPKPGNPSQLLSKLRQEGYALHGYNHEAEKDGPRPPCSHLALGLIYRITDALETSHKKRQVEVSYPCPKNSLKGNDMMYVLQTFSLRGFEIKYDLEGGFFKANWKTDAWDWNEGPKLPTLAQPTTPVPEAVQLELCGTEKGERSEISTIKDLLSLLGEQQVLLKLGVRKLGVRMQQPGFWTRRNWGSPGEVALFQVSLNGVYDAAMIGGNNFSTEFELDVRAGELVKYFQEVGFRVTLSIEKNGGNPRQRLTLGWDIL